MIEGIGRDMKPLALSCVECGRHPPPAELWRLYFSDRVAREVVIYCPECAEREFGEPES